MSRRRQRRRALAERRSQSQQGPQLPSEGPVESPRPRSPLEAALARRAVRGEDGSQSARQRGAGRAPEQGSPDRTARRRGVRFSPLAVVVAMGLVLRLAVAYVFLPGSGFAADISRFGIWALELARSGPGDFYAGGGGSAPPPAVPYVLWPVGALANAFGIDTTEAAAGVVKLAPILLDLVAGVLVYRLVRVVLRAHPRRESLAVTGAAFYLFNPVTWYVSAVWGQLDVLAALVLLGVVLLLVDGYSEGAAAVAVAGFLVRLDVGVAAAVLVAAVLAKRHLARPGSGPRPAFGSRWLPDEDGPWRLVSSGAAALVVLVAALLPFRLSIGEFGGILARDSGSLAVLTANAYNAWALVGTGGRAPLAIDGSWSSDSEPLFGLMPAYVVGLVATTLVVAGIALAVFRRDDRRTIVLAGAALVLALFMLPTRVHERYLFAAFALLPVLAIRARPWLIAFVALSAAAWVNLHAVLTRPGFGTDAIANFALGEIFRAAPVVVVAVLVGVAVLLLLLSRLIPLVRAALERTPLAPRPRVERARIRRTRLGLPEAATLAMPGTGEAATPLGAVTRGALPRGLPAWEEELAPGRSASLVRAVPGAAISAVRRRLAVPPVRADLSGALRFEPSGRLDKLDLLVVALVVVSALTLRTWRLEEPYEMHFDEVYHARTATEFLQDWRYRIPHDIYEYTHPHLAKYLIALGIVAFGSDRVTGETDLGTPVTAAAVEPRWAPLDNPDARNGDRLYVATGTGVRAYDLQTRRLIAEIPGPAQRLVLDDDSHVIYTTDSAGGLFSVPTRALDELRTNSAASVPAPTRVADLPAAPIALGIAGDGRNVLAVLPRDRLVSVSPESGEVTAQTTIAGITATLPLDDVEAIVAEPGVIQDPAAAASSLAEALDDDARRIEQLLASNVPRVVVAAFVTDERRSSVRRAIDDGELEGISLESQGTVAVASESGITVIDGTTLQRLAAVALDGATGMAMVSQGLESPTLYVANGSRLDRVVIESETSPRSSGVLEMPGVVRDVRWNESTGLVHVLGEAPDGGGDTIYVVEPHGNAVFADARLPFEPVAWLIDAQHDRPSEDRQEILTVGDDGALAVVDAGNNAFGWRFPGVLAGAAMAGLLYVLGRILFRRRSVAVIAALLALVDGMFFVNARIAMNDAYVSLFIVAAFTAFAALYVDRWRGPSALLFGPPLVGLFLGLALASKWVGAYALGTVLLLVLFRSAVGRVVALAGMVLLTGVLGFLAISGSPQVDDPQRNVLFLVLMVALTVLLSVAMVVRPIRLSPSEHRFAVVGLAVAGVALALVAALAGSRLPAQGLVTARSLMVGGGALLAMAIAAHFAPDAVRRLGFGSQMDDDATAVVDRPAPAERSWMNPGWAGGLPWLWAMACIAVVPLIVYVISFVPWAQPWHEGGPRLADAWPIIGTWPPGHQGQTFVELQRSMYDYHNNLRATHAASSPWWAWPLDLKPVWFYSDSFGLGGGNGIIYDAGNMVLFWLAIPAVAWAAWQAWRRRSLALTLVVIAIAGLWLPWARIDRATFQYHIFTSLPFAFLALAYFLAELWHGPSRSTWALARLAGAGALLLPAVLWLSRPMLCALADTERVRPGGQACGSVTEQFILTQRWGAALVVALAGLTALAWQWYARDRRAERPDAVARSATPWLPLTAVATVIGIVLAIAVMPDATVLSFTIGQGPPYLLALVALVVLAVPALFILEARDPRRFAVVAVGAAAFWFIAFYPYLSGLPVPSGISGWYQTLPLPTWNYDFQFAVNTDPPFQTPNLFTNGLAISAGVAALCLAAMYTANAWRLELARRRYERSREAVGAAEA